MNGEDSWYSKDRKIYHFWAEKVDIVCVIFSGAIFLNVCIPWCTWYLLLPGSIEVSCVYTSTGGYRVQYFFRFFFFLKKSILLEPS